MQIFLQFDEFFNKKLQNSNFMRFEIFKSIKGCDLVGKSNKELL